MALVSAFSLPFAQIFLRKFITNEISLDAAGYWQAMMRISDGYLIIVVTALNTYYIPKLSSIKSNSEIKKEIFDGYKILVPALIVISIFVYYLRYYIIQILYTPEFEIIEKLFVWQLIGDFFKIMAWVISYLLIAKAKTKIFILSEVLFSLTYIVFGRFFVIEFGLEGISIAFALNYVFYLLFMILIYKKITSVNLKEITESKR